VVTGIRLLALAAAVVWAYKLQWGPVVVTGISALAARREPLGVLASMGSGRGDRNQIPRRAAMRQRLRFNGVRSW